MPNAFAAHNGGKAHKKIFWQGAKAWLLFSDIIKYS
jgi:hypothetical protein